MKKIIIFGARGMLCCATTEYFKRRGWEVLSITRSEFDIAKKKFEKITSIFDNALLVINAAGVIRPQIAKMYQWSTRSFLEIWPKFTIN